MRAVCMSILFAVAVFFSSACAEEIKTMSLYLDQNGSFVWLDGDTSRINMLVEAFKVKGFEKIEGQIQETSCIVDTFAVLAVGEERGTMVTCGRNSNLDLRNNDPQYLEKIVEHVDLFIQYIRSPFTGEVEKNEILLRNDQERSCVFLESTEFKKDKKGSELYESQSRVRLVFLQEALEKRGYVEKQANWTLCNAVFAKRRCVIEMDHMEGKQLMPLETVISCYDINRTRIMKSSVRNSLLAEEYVNSILHTVQEGMRELLNTIQIKEE